MRQRILCAVGMVFHSYGGQVFAGSAVLVHVASGDHGKQRRKRRACPSFPGHVARACQNLGYARGGLRRHFLDPRHHHRVIKTSRYALPRMEKGAAARSAGVLDAGAGNVAEASRHPNIRSEMVLPDKRRAGKVTQVKRFHRRSGDSRIC